MFLGYWIIITFIVGLPISFGIGGLIGYFIWKRLKPKCSKDKLIILSGIIYIISQPISYIAEAFYDGMLNILFLVPFALCFTIIVSIIIAKIIWKK